MLLKKIFFLLRYCVLTKAYVTIDLGDKDVRDVIEDIIKNISSICALKTKIPDSILNNEDVVIYILSNAGSFLSIVPENIKSNQKFVRAAVRENPSAILFASLSIQEDEVFIDELIDFCIRRKKGNNFDFFFKLPYSIRANKSLVKKVLEYSKIPFYKYEPSIQEDMECIEIMLKHNPHSIIYVSPEFINDELLLKYIHKRPDLFIDKCSLAIKKDRRLIWSLLDNNCDFFDKVYTFYTNDKRMILKYLSLASIGEIQRFPILKKDKRAIRYLLLKGVYSKNARFLNNYENFLSFVEYEEFINKIDICRKSSNDITSTFKFALDWEIAEIKRDRIKKILDVSITKDDDCEDDLDSLIYKL